MKSSSQTNCIARPLIRRLALPFGISDKSQSPKTNNGQIPVIMRVTENHNNIACLELAKMTFGWGPKRQNSIMGDYLLGAWRHKM